jgi:hypothetical protein
MSNTLKELEALFESQDRLRTTALALGELDTVAWCDRRMDLIQDRIVDEKAKSKKEK